MNVCLPHKHAHQRGLPRLRLGLAWTAAVLGLVLPPPPALAQTAPPRGASNPSHLSSAPLVMSTSVPAAFFVASGLFTLVAVERGVNGSRWVLQRQADGLLASVHFAGDVSLGVGAVLTVASLATAQVLLVSGRAVAVIPNEVGARLFHHEQVAP
jgi:hypothetical protein